MKVISELLFAHRDEVAWIFGKGPSLDAFDMRTVGDLRICINESLLAVDRPTYFFAHDETPIKRVSGRWPEGCRAILQPVRAEYAAQQGLPDGSIYTYTKRHEDKRVLGYAPEKTAEEAVLYGQSGTVHSALHFCRLIGASAVRLVGFDGKGGYARSLELPSGGRHHSRIRQDSVTLMRILKLPYRFCDPQGTLGSTCQ